MSDTPRTDAARPPYTELQEFVSAEFARTLERELNAASKERDDALMMLGMYRMKSDEQKQRIKRLESVVNDPHALWANWLRGSVALPVGIGDVRQYQERIKRLEEAGDAMINEEYNKPRHVEQWRKAKEVKP